MSSGEKQSLNSAARDNTATAEDASLAEARRIVAPSGMVVCGRKLPAATVASAVVLTIFFVGIGLGFATAHTNTDPEPWNVISSIIGWWYFFAWAVSFLPQIYLNHVRRSVIGQSFDYVFLNILGYTAYSVYAVSFYGVQTVRADYHDRFGSDNTVDVNDVAFALWALACCLVNGAQIAFFDRGTQVTSLWAIVLIVVTTILVLLWCIIILAGVHESNVFNVLDLLYGISIVKLAVSIIKYIPQIYLNFKRKCTVGWNIWNVLLDLSGGSLSVLQQLIDCGTTGRWNGIAGNPVKFFLGCFSMIYDVIFIFQHFVLYRANNKRLHDQLAAEKEEGEEGRREGAGDGSA